MREKKKKKKIILIIILVPIIVIGVLAAIYFYQQYRINSIVKEYGEAVERAVRNYRSSHDGKIPSYEQIEDNIVYKNHYVKCYLNQVNSDGSIYLSRCTIDDTHHPKLKYGEKKVAVVYKDSKLYLCRNNDNNNYFFMPDYCDYAEMVYTYECENANCQGYSFNKSNTETIIYDGKNYIFNVYDKSKKYINIGDKKYNGINYVEGNNKTYGLILNLYEYTGNSSISEAYFYNFGTQQITKTASDYYDMYSVESLLSKKYIFASRSRENNKYFYTDIVNFDTGEVIKSFSDVSSFGENKIGYYAYSTGKEDRINLYDKEFNLIVETKNLKYGINSDNTITIVKDKHFEIINLDKELLYTSDDYYKIVLAVEDYLVITDEDNNLKIIDLEENEKATLVKLTDNLNVQPYISGWYTENGKNGIYVVVENKDIPFGTNGSGLEYYYIPSTGETGVIKTEGVGGYAKPILYLYPEKKTNIKVSFEKPYLLTTTYPKYKNTWEVTANPNGDLYDKNGKYYYGLYWEEEGSIDVDFNTGFYVTKDNAIDFLEEKLSYLGLNPRERNEFIMYWLPILEKNEQNLVYFETTSERESYNKLRISPEPDSILRLAIHVKKVNEPTTIQEQKLERFTRKGFTVVEWGGVIH